MEHVSKLILGYVYIEKYEWKEEGLLMFLVVF